MSACREGERDFDESATEIEDVGQGGCGDVRGNTVVEVGSPDRLGLHHPGVPFQKRIEDHVGIEQDASHPYFLMRSASMIRLHSSSVGGGASVFKMPMT